MRPLSALLMLLSLTTAQAGVTMEEVYNKATVDVKVESWINVTIDISPENCTDFKFHGFSEDMKKDRNLPYWKGELDARLKDSFVASCVLDTDRFVIPALANVPDGYKYHPEDFLRSRTDIFLPLLNPPTPQDRAFQSLSLGWSRKAFTVLLSAGSMRAYEQELQDSLANTLVESFKAGKLKVTVPMTLRKYGSSEDQAKALEVLEVLKQDRPYGSERGR